MDPPGSEHRRRKDRILSYVQLALLTTTIGSFIMVAPWSAALTPDAYERKHGVKVDHSVPAYVNDHGTPRPFPRGTVADHPWQFSAWLVALVASLLGTAYIAKRDKRVREALP
jgi:hypothetical protein